MKKNLFTLLVVLLSLSLLLSACGGPTPAPTAKPTNAPAPTKASGGGQTATKKAPVPPAPSSTELTEAEKTGAETLAAAISQALGITNGAWEAYKLPAATTWDDVINYYDQQVKEAGWSPDAGAAQDLQGGKVAVFAKADGSKLVIFYAQSAEAVEVLTIFSSPDEQPAPSTEQAPDAPASTNSIVGTWQDVSDATNAMTLTEDGKIIIGGGESTYTYDGSALTITAQDGSTLNYTVEFSGDQMILTNPADGEKMAMVKAQAGTADPTAAPATGDAVTIGQLPVFSGATESDNAAMTALLQTLTDGIKETGATDIDGKAYETPDGTAWDTVKAFYSAELEKAGWAEAEPGDNSQSWVRSNQALIVKASADGTTLLIVLFTPAQ